MESKSIDNVASANYKGMKGKQDDEMKAQLKEQKEYNAFVTSFQANRERALGIISEVEADLPIPEKPLKYGTAGFRGRADTLERCAFRVGIFVAFRAKITGVCGVMITASHNGPEDNGVKIVEKDGSMLDPNWEEWAEFIVNSEDIKNTLLNLNELTIKGLPFGFDVFELNPLPKKEVGAETLEEMKEREKGNVVPQPDVWPKVFVGMDTRESSPKLMELLLRGIDAVKCPYSK